MKAILSAESIAEIQRLYEMKDAYGRRMYSQFAIAQLLGIGETSVYRAIHRQVRIPLAQIDNRAKESEAKFQAMLSPLERLQSEIKEAVEKPARIDSILDEL